MFRCTRCDEIVGVMMCHVIMYSNWQHNILSLLLFLNFFGRHVHMSNLGVTCTPVLDF